MLHDECLNGGRPELYSFQELEDDDENRLIGLCARYHEGVGSNDSDVGL